MDVGNVEHDLHAAERSQVRKIGRQAARSLAARSDASEPECVRVKHDPANPSARTAAGVVHANAMRAGRSQGPHLGVEHGPNLAIGVAVAI
jgi:hypothetical protein